MAELVREVLIDASPETVFEYLTVPSRHDAVVQHTHGWDHYLARLAIATPGGDAGPDAGPAGS